MTKIVIYLSWFLCLGVLATSCAPTTGAAYFKKYEKIEGINEPDRNYLNEIENRELIQPGDKLFISVSSGSDEPNSFNQPAGGAFSSLDLLTYDVDNDGYIKLPYLNKKKVSGLTITQVTDSLETELSQYIYLPTITIHFASSRITVVGELNSPGVYEFNSKSITIYQAIAYAGDIAPYGNRKNVMIVRNEGDNIVQKRVDLTNDQILMSKWYYIQANDIIYVEPLARKSLGIETFPWDIFFSIITTFILTYTFVTNQPF